MDIDRKFEKNYDLCRNFFIRLSGMPEFYEVKDMVP